MLHIGPVGRLKQTHMVLYMWDWVMIVLDTSHMMYIHAGSANYALCRQCIQIAIQKLWVDMQAEADTWCYACRTTQFLVDTTSGICRVKRVWEMWGKSKTWGKSMCWRVHPYEHWSELLMIQHKYTCTWSVLEFTELYLCKLNQIAFWKGIFYKITSEM